MRVAQSVAWPGVLLLVQCGAAPMAPGLQGQWAALGGYETEDEARALTARHGTGVEVLAALTTGRTSAVLYGYSTHAEWRDHHPREAAAAAQHASGCDASCGRCEHHRYPSESIHRTGRGACVALHVALVDLPEEGKARVRSTVEVEPYVCGGSRADLVERPALEAGDLDGDGRNELRVRYGWASAPAECTRMRSWFRTERIYDLSDLHQQARVVLEDGTTESLERHVTALTLEDRDRDGHRDLMLRRTSYERACARGEDGWPRRAPEGQAATGCSITEVREEHRWDSERDLWLPDAASRRETTYAGVVAPPEARAPLVQGPVPDLGPLGERLHELWRQYGGGRTPTGAVGQGSGMAGATQDFDLELDGGRCYTVIGAGEVTLTDLDMFLFDPQGAQAAQDQATDNFPIVQACPQHAGRYRLQLKVYAGQGSYAWQVFGDGAPAPVTPPPPPPSLSGVAPPPIGIPECDAFVARACRCTNEPLRAQLCTTATTAMSGWQAAIAASPASRDVIVQACAAAESGIRAACP